MKPSSAICSLLLCFSLTLVCQRSDAQLIKKLKKEIKDRAERKVVNKAGDATDKTIDDITDGATRKKKKDNDNNEEDSAGNNGGDKEKASVNPFSVYRSYDFVPGDKIIFQPDLSNEPDAELPARFIVYNGNAEIQSYQGEKVLHLNPDSYVSVGPQMTTSEYLPEKFTVEFDMMYENTESYFGYVNEFIVNFRSKDDKDQKMTPVYSFAIESNSGSFFGPDPRKTVHFPDELKESVNTNNKWHHVAIYVNKNIGKAYVDQYRVNATNTLPTGANYLNIKTDRYGIKIKNFRLAEGGDDKYKKIVTDGKFITHGILFDVNKATIRPESMGTLNEIAKMLKEHSDLRFEIDGHTDSDGNADNNMKLSIARAQAVKDRLVELGIDEGRLTTKGFGSTKPIDTNDSAEGKAQNRRVEFIKL
jgi:outer membrane protein OmpA-like peptidoglycan-associated protein